MTENRVNIFLAALGIFMGAVLLVAMLLPFAVGATQPPCTGDRHYDGVACCPAVPETTTTTTTLPGVDPNACPDPGPCQPVTCNCDCGSPAGANTGTVTINVDRCPDRAVRCWTDRKGKEHCPTNAHPRRFWRLYNE